MNRRRGRPVVSEERPGDSGGPLAALRVSAPGNSARSALGECAAGQEREVRRGSGRPACGRGSRSALAPRPRRGGPSRRRWGGRAG